MKTQVVKRLTAAGLALAFASASASLPAAGYDPQTGDPGAAMAADALFARPIGLIGAVLGAALWVVSLPFTLPSRSADEAGQALVGAPLQYTFERPLGVEPRQWSPPASHD
ncbi:MAG: hypothetical protein DI596_14005 [Azospira oryzae]|nr:MAG: hypothetical protein DI596_14005 [Azospira oryzae]PZP76688.1 MAG: hypothetical protein DI593_14005 [Azospira oryzae]